MQFDSVTNPPEESQVSPPSPARGNAILKYVLIAIGVAYAAASLYLIYDLRTRLAAMEQRQQTVEAAQVELGNRIHATSSEFKQALSSEVGMTKQELARRAAELD